MAAQNLLEPGNLHLVCIAQVKQALMSYQCGASLKQGRDHDIKPAS
jgi:hypothetical protein